MLEKEFADVEFEVSDELDELAGSELAWLAEFLRKNSNMTFKEIRRYLHQKVDVTV